MVVMKSSSENRTQRAVSILLVLVLHALLIFALLRFMAPQNAAFRAVPQPRLFEMFINTAHFPKPGTRKEAPASAPGARQPKPQAPSEHQPHQSQRPPRRISRASVRHWLVVRRRTLPISMKRNGSVAGNSAHPAAMIPALWTMPITPTKCRAQSNGHGNLHARRRRYCCRAETPKRSISSIRAHASLRTSQMGSRSRSSMRTNHRISISPAKRNNSG